MSITFDQAGFDIRCEWGEQGIIQLAATSDAVIIVDVLSFSTCVSIAVARGALVFPYRWRDQSAEQFAASVQAQLAQRRGNNAYTLSPGSLLNVPTGLRLVLPSPNGSTLTLATDNTSTFAGCLRNAKTVAAAAMDCGSKISVIPAGERWISDGSLRPALEDLVGAGAIVQYLRGKLSAEAQLALDAFKGAERAGILTRLTQCVSGQELISRGYQEDVELAAQVDVDHYAPMLIEGAYRYS